MRQAIWLFWILLLALPVSGASAAGGRPGSEPASGVRVGSQAPDLTLRTLDGQTVKLSDYRGKVVMLNFWATWCPPCRAEMPSMERLYKLMAGEDFVMLALNVEENGGQTVKAFLKSSPHTFPVLLDEDAKAQNTYRVFRFPETFIISREGVIMNHILGAREWDEESTVQYLKFLVKG